MSTSTTAARPMPEPKEWDEAYWRAAADGRLLVQVCAACGLARSFPRIMCGACGSLEHDWQQSTGHGTIYSWSVLRHSFHPGFTDLPLPIAIVELADHPQVHLVANILAVDEAVLADPRRCAEALEIGTPVTVTFEHLAGGSLPQFEIAAADAT